MKRIALVSPFPPESTGIADYSYELAAALARNKVLEDNQEQVRNRIDWVIDSLHNLMDE